MTSDASSSIVRSPPARTRADLCPGVLRPWPAEDGGLVRLRLIGGEISAAQLTELAEVAARYGDGRVHLTARANLQLRGLSLIDGRLPDPIVAALAGTGLVPHPVHELVRNVMVSPLSGLLGGVANLHPVARAFDSLVCADERLAGLPGRFLVVLDDGRGDVADRRLDLGVVAVDADHAQIRAGAGWGPIVALDDVPAALVGLSHQFLDARGGGPTAAWHVAELAAPLLREQRDPRARNSADPLPHGRFEGGEHRDVPDGILTPTLVSDIAAASSGRLVVTAWSGIVLPDVS